MTHEELYQGLEALYADANATEACYKEKANELYNKSDMLFKEKEDSVLSSEGKGVIAAGAGAAALTLGGMFAFPIATVAGIAAATYGGASLAINHIKTRLAANAEEKGYLASDISTATISTIFNVNKGKINPAEYDSIESILAASQAINYEDYINAGGDPEFAPKKEINLKDFNKLTLMAHTKNPDLFSKSSETAMETFAGYLDAANHIAETELENTL